MGEGATWDRDPEKIAVSGALCACSSAACRGRGVRDRVGPRVSETESEGGERATEGRGVRARARWPAVAGGLRLGAAGPVGLGLFSLFFELRQRVQKNKIREIYNIFI